MKIKNAVIFGDSYSTFEGYVPEGYVIYYSTRDRAETDVRRVKETWWHGLCSEMGINLVLNDSWSGSTLCYTGYEGDCSTTSSFIFRLEKLISDGFFEKNEIDTVFVFGCTNDSWADAPLGEAMFSDIKREDLFKACPAICYFLGRLKEILPAANIIFIINTGLKSEICDTVKKASEYYSTHFVELYDIDKNCGHPTIKGMAEIKDQVLEFIANN